MVKLGPIHSEHQHWRLRHRKEMTSIALFILSEKSLMLNATFNVNRPLSGLAELPKVELTGVDRKAGA